jgi:glucose-6-phosphate 1-dehydrogenase
MPSGDDRLTLIIFGASGDLTRRKLVPALWSLYAARLLPEPFTIVAVARTAMGSEDFRRRMRGAVAEFGRVQPPSEHVWERFAANLVYVAGDSTSPEFVPVLAGVLGRLEESARGHRLFYCATPPSLYEPIVRNLGAPALAGGGRGWTRLVIEKPFGRDLASARALNRQLIEVFREEQVDRSDHYLGKERSGIVAASRPRPTSGCCST